MSRKTRFEDSPFKDCYVSMSISSDLCTSDRHNLYFFQKVLSTVVVDVFEEIMGYDIGVSMLLSETTVTMALL